MNRVLTETQIHAFAEALYREEKSSVTVKKYIRDANAFLRFTEGRELTKELTMAYKQQLQEKGYAVRSINSMLASVNSLLVFLDWQDCKVKTLRVQRQIYTAETKELTKNEYLRLLQASVENPQLNLLLQTLCATGIRISELQHFTVEALRMGEISVRCKSKTRVIFVPTKLQRMLLTYAKQHKITSGPIFVSQNGNPLDRSNIWSQMKTLCQTARVDEKKVYPHNFRKLFARTFYSAEKDIAKLADILGHSSIETTRIYIMSTGQEHRKKIDRLGLIP